MLRPVATAGLALSREGDAMAAKKEPARAVEEDPDPPLVPYLTDGVAFHGMYDAGDGRVLAWLASEPGGANVIMRKDGGDPVPFIVTWLWNEPAANEGSPGPGWEYRSVHAARRRFASEVAQAIEAES